MQVDGAGSNANPSDAGSAIGQLLDSHRSNASSVAGLSVHEDEEDTEEDSAMKAARVMFKKIDRNKNGETVSASF